MTAIANTLTVKAKQVKPGDRIDGRTIKHVVRGSSGSTRNAANSHGQNISARLPNLTFTSSVIEIFFEDCSAPLYRWPNREVQVQR